jgi:hypothetical protein
LVVFALTFFADFAFVIFVLDVFALIVCDLTVLCYVSMTDSGSVIYESNISDDE